MDPSSLSRHSDFEWWIDPAGKMRVPAIIYAGEDLIRGMDEKVREQLTNVATLPGIQRAAYAMPDAHWGYGFPIGGVAAFDPNEGGIISAGGVGFDISCGVRTMRTTLTMEELQRSKTELEGGAPIVPMGTRRAGTHRDDGCPQMGLFQQPVNGSRVSSALVHVAGRHRVLLGEPGWQSLVEGAGRHRRQRRRR